MQKKNYPENTEIIKEGECAKKSSYPWSDFLGDAGEKMYVLDQGVVSVTKGSQFITDLGTGQLFGELAILYNCRRTATIVTKTKVSAWYLERGIFQVKLRI